MLTTTMKEQGGIVGKKEDTAMITVKTVDVVMVDAMTRMKIDLGIESVTRKGEGKMMKSKVEKANMNSTAGMKLTAVGAEKTEVNTMIVVKMVTMKESLIVIQIGGSTWTRAMGKNEEDTIKGS